VAEVDEVELPFPILGEDLKYRVRPIPRRRSSNTTVDPAEANLNARNRDASTEETLSSGTQRAMGRVLASMASSAAEAPQ
jgi:hypothetical protein